MRLLSFLSDLEKALLAESPAIDGGAWESSRTVNFHKGLARLTLTPRPGNDFPAGSIMAQSYTLADGAVCVKVGLTWATHPGAMPTISVYDVPGVNWKLEASRLASLWLEGPNEKLLASGAPEQIQPLAIVS